MEEVDPETETNSMKHTQGSVKEKKENGDERLSKLGILRWGALPNKTEVPLVSGTRPCQC